MARKQVRTPKSKADLEALIVKSVSEWVSEEIDLDYMLYRINANISRMAIVTREIAKKQKELDAIVYKHEFKLEFYPGKFVFGSEKNIKQLEEMIEHLFPTVDPYPAAQRGTQ